LVEGVVPEISDPYPTHGGNTGMPLASGGARGAVARFDI